MHPAVSQQVSKIILWSRKKLWPLSLALRNFISTCLEEVFHFLWTTDLSPCCLFPNVVFQCYSFVSLSIWHWILGFQGSCQCGCTVSIATKDHGRARKLYCILHGWPAEKCIPDELKIYYGKQDKFTIEDGCILHSTKAVILAKISGCCLIGVTFKSSWNGPHKVHSQIALYVWWPCLDQGWANSARLPCLPSKLLWESSKI